MVDLWDAFFEKRGFFLEKSAFTVLYVHGSDKDEI